MESTAIPVAVDLSISHQQSCHSWTPDKVNHHVLKHSESTESFEAESRFSVVSHDGNEYSDSDSDHKPTLTNFKVEEREVVSRYSELGVDNSNSSESHTIPYHEDCTPFFPNFGHSQLRTSAKNVFLCESEDQNSSDVNKKVVVPSLLNHVGIKYENLSELPVDLDTSARNRQNECIEINDVSENDVKLPLQMTIKLNNKEKMVYRRTGVSIFGPLSTALEHEKAHLLHKKHGNIKTADVTEDLQDPSACLSDTATCEPAEPGTCNRLEGSVMAIDSVIKEEPLKDAPMDSCIPQKLSVKSEEHNGVLKDNDSDTSDGKVESGESSDGDTHESFVNETDDSKISLDNDDEAEYKSVVKYPLRCVVCLRDFLYRAEYIHHCNLHESYDANILLQIANLPDPVKPEEDGLPFYCEMCGKGFMNKQAIKHHFIIHTDERPHTCNICKKSYRHRSALYKHKRSHTDVLAYACEVCGKRFKHKSYLNIHAVIHTQQRPYSCSICGSTFRDRSARNKHLHAHSGVRPYSCEVCGKCFGRKGDFKSHSVIHTEQRPYKCDVCGRGFRSSSNYHRHSRTHTTDCPYKCDICGKSFNQNWKLKEHKFIHSDKLPYVCEICGAGFKYPRKYKQHMENHARERLHNQETAASAGQMETPAYEVMDVQPDISVLLEQ